jgi:hypothetical protein
MDLLQLWEKEQDELLAQCCAEFSQSYQAFNTLKIRFNDRKDLIAKIDKAETELTDNTIAWIRRTLLALYYTDQMKVQVVWTNPYTRETWEDRTNMFESDYVNCNMDVLDYIVQTNRFDYWVGIRFIHWWNEKTSTPIYSVESPISRRPDPSWWLSPESFAYMTFERTANLKYVKSVLSEYVDQSVLNQLQWNISPTEQQKKEAEKTHRLIQNAWWTKDDVTILYHLTIWKDKTVQVCYSNDRLFLYAKEVWALTEAMNSTNPQLQSLKFPVALNYFEPEEGNPFGISLFDYAEDSQKFKTLMFNLMKIKAVKQAMGWTMVIDKLAYKANKAILESKKVWLKILPVDSDPGRGVMGMASFLPEDQLSQDVYNFPQIIDQKLQDNLGISDQVRWLDDGKVKTKAEVINSQQNANINLLLWNKINARGERTFRSLFYVFYKHYRDKTSKKLITINKWIMNTSIYYTRKDMIDYVDPMINVQNKSTVDQVNAKALENLQLTFMQDVQDASMPEISKRYLKRKMKRLIGWLSRHELDIIYPPSVEEMQAKQDILLLNRNIPVKIRSMDENHIDYIIMYQMALRTPATNSAIEMRKKAYIQSWQAMMAQQMAQQAMMWGNGWLINSAQNQMLSQSQNQIPTNQW